MYELYFCVLIYGTAVGLDQGCCGVLGLFGLVWFDLIGWAKGNQSVIGDLWCCGAVWYYVVVDLSVRAAWLVGETEARMGRLDGTRSNARPARSLDR